MFLECSAIVKNSVLARKGLIRTPLSFHFEPNTFFNDFFKVVGRFSAVAIAHLTNLSHLSYIMVSKSVVTLQNHVYVFPFSQKYNIVRI